MLKRHTFQFGVAGSQLGLAFGLSFGLAVGCGDNKPADQDMTMATGGDLAGADLMGAANQNCDGTPKAADGAEDPFYPLQWHLKNTEAGGTDLNLGTSWTTTRGDGLLAVVVDDGMEVKHEDLAINTKTGGGRNFWAGQQGFSMDAADPTPMNPAMGDPPAHGTAVAGIIAARDLNGRGVRGVAPRACLAGVNLIATGGQTPVQEAEAMSHRLAEAAVSNNSWGATDGTGLTDGGTMEWFDSIKQGVTMGRGGRGTIYVWAGGNGANTRDAMMTGFEADNSNLDGQANDPSVIAICGLMNDGKRVNYSERGANLWVCGFSESTNYDNDNRGTTTTDISGMQGYNARAAQAGTMIDGRDYANGDYTQGFNGTSSATPTVAGVVALMLGANPNLGWRDVRLILAESAKQNDAGNTEWQVNKGTRVTGQGGYRINHNYGFGQADAGQAVQLAKTWTNVGPRTLQDSGVKMVNRMFPDNNQAGAEDGIQIAGSTIERIEAIEVILTATGDISDLDVRLTGSLGTESRLAEPHNCYKDRMLQPRCDRTYDAWRFSTMRHLGESANQTWTLRVSDRRAGRTNGGNIVSWRLVLHGRAN